MSDPEITQLFLRVLASPENLQDHFDQIEHFVSLIYDKTIIQGEQCKKTPVHQERAYAGGNSTHSRCS
jgi:hypothetical protein